MTKQIVVIGTSAGGIEALRRLIAAIPGNFQAPIAIVVHTAPDSPGVLGDILNRAGTLPVSPARDLDRLRSGHIYIAPPDRHLLVEPGRLRLTRGPKENRFRPAIDPLFRSAAQVFGPGAIGVVLTGHLDDGTAGLWAIKRLGGTAVVQDPSDALFPSMPESAIRHVDVDHIVRLTEIPPLLVQLTEARVEEMRPHTASKQLEVEVDIAREKNRVDAGIQEIAQPSSFACPECHGVLLQMDEDGRIRFRCHTGHAYSVESLLASINEAIEESIWNAVRALGEGTMLMERISEHLRTHEPDERSGELRNLRERIEALRGHAEILRKLATELEPSPSGTR